MLYKGGQNVEKGTYWNTFTGERLEISESQALPGGENTIYVRAKSGWVLLAGPVLGLCFAVFLPFIGILMAMGQFGKAIAKSSVGQAVQSVSFGWRPIEAYLAGRKRKKEERAKRKEKQ